MSEKLDELNLNELISLGYNFYLVHTGSHAFFKRFADKVMTKISHKTSTYDLLRILQTFSEISEPFAKLFVQIDSLLVDRFEQLDIDEICVAVCGFAVSGYGTEYMYQIFEQAIKQNISKLST